MQHGTNIAVTTVNSLDHPALQPLWERQRAYHGQLASPFAVEIGARIFADRCAELLAQAHHGHLRVDLAQDTATGVFVGYCITTVTAQVEGEIDSLFVDDAYRGMGIGDALMQRALAWLDELEVHVRRISVAGGNEAVLGFYQRYGFSVRTHVLLNTPTKSQEEAR